MSIHDDIMLGGGANAIMDAQADPLAGEYRPPTASGIAAFQVDVNTGIQDGAEVYLDGDLVKVLTLGVTLYTAQLVAQGITEIQRQATVFVNGREWSIDLAKSHWGASLVTLGLMSRKISRFEEMEDHAAV